MSTRYKIIIALLLVIGFLGQLSPAIPQASAAGVLTYKGVDVMKWTKDTITNQPSDVQINNIVQAITSTLKPTHIAISIPMDPNVDYPAYNTPSPRTAEQFTQTWSDSVHNHGAKVTWRGTWSGIEGLYSFPQQVGSNRLPAGTATTAATDGNSTWLGKTYNYISSHAAFFQDGDIWAPLPERTQGIFQDSSSFLPGTGAGIQANYANFFNDLKTVSDAAFAKIGKHVITGLSANNFSEVNSSWLPQSIFDVAGMTVVDHYGITHTTQEMDANLRYIYSQRGKPIFLQEWGDYWDSSLPDADRAVYLNSMYAEFQSLVSAGILAGYDYWGAWPGNQEGILTDLGGGNYQINSRGLLLANLFGTPVPPPPPPPVLAPIINSLSASPAGISAGQSSTLSWSVSGSPTSLNLDNSLGNVLGLISKIVSPAVTTTYTLTAANSSGSAAKVVTISVTPLPPPPPPPPPPPIILPVISNLKVSGITSSSALITWNTDKPTDGKIIYGINGYTKSTQLYSAGSPTVNHSIRLQNLKSGSKYSFQVQSKDNSGNAAFSIGGSFTTSGRNRQTATISAQKPIALLPAGSHVGDVIKFGKNPTVYLARADGLYPFDSFASYTAYIQATGVMLITLNTTASNFAVKNVPAKYVLAQVAPLFGNLGPIPGAIGSLPDGSLINVSGTIYVLSNQTKIPFTSLQVFLDLGYSLQNVIKMDSTAYPTSQNYELSSSAQAHPAGSWIVDNNTVYYVRNAGIVLVPNEQIFQNNGGRHEILLPADFADQAGISTRLDQTPMSAGDLRIQN